VLPGVRRCPWYAIVVGVIFIAGVLVHLSPHIRRFPWDSSSQAKSDAPSIDLGELHYPFDPIKVDFPLHRLGIKAKMVEGIRATCGCTKTSVDAERGEMEIIFTPRQDMGRVHERIFVRMRRGEPRIRVIHLRATVIPVWTARPPSLFLRRVLPDEDRRFSCWLSAGRTLRVPWVSRLVPDSDSISLSSKQVGPSVIHVQGEIRGTTGRSRYDGRIEVLPENGSVPAKSIPITVEYVPPVRSEPRVITLSAHAPRERNVRFEHFRYRKLRIKNVRCPPYLDVVPSESLGSVKVRIKSLDGIEEASVTVSKVTVWFEELDSPARFRVVVLANPPED